MYVAAYRTHPHREPGPSTSVFLCPSITTCWLGRKRSLLPYAYNIYTCTYKQVCVH